MRPKEISLRMTVADPNGICASQTVAGAADLIINGALYKADTVAYLGTAAAVRITSAADDSGIIFTVYGMAADGGSIEETVTGANATTVDTSQSFKTITRVVSSGATAGNVTVGTAADDDCFATSETLAAANGFAHSGVACRSCKMYGTATIVQARTLRVVSAGDDSLVTFTAYGRDADGLEVSDAITGTAIGTSSGTVLFSEVIDVATDGATASTVTVGVAGDLDFICESQSLSAAGSLVFNGAGCSVQARHVSITAAGDESTKTFTVGGYDRKGLVLTEVITGPNTTTVKGTKNFSVVHTVRASAALAGNVTVGSADECESQLIPTDIYALTIGIRVERSVDANLEHRFAYTRDYVLDGSMDEYTASYIYPADWASANQAEAITSPVCAVRLMLRSFVRGTLDMQVVTSSS